MDHYPYGYHDSLDNLDFTFEQFGKDLNSLRFAARPEGDPLAAFTLYDSLSISLFSPSHLHLTSLVIPSEVVRSMPVPFCLHH